MITTSSFGFIIKVYFWYKYYMKYKSVHRINSQLELGLKVVLNILHWQDTIILFKPGKKKNFLKT